MWSHVHAFMSFPDPPCHAMRRQTLGIVWNGPLCGEAHQPEQARGHLGPAAGPAQHAVHRVLCVRDGDPRAPGALQHPAGPCVRAVLCACPGHRLHGEDPWSYSHHLAQMCPSSGCRDMPIFMGCRGRSTPIMAEDLLRIAEGRPWDIACWCFKGFKLYAGKMQGLSIYAYALQVTSRDGGELSVKRSLGATAMPETPVGLVGSPGKRRKLN